MLLDGLHVPVTTPFYPDGRLNLRKLEHNFDRYSRTPAAGLAVLSDIGEPDMLSDAETREALTAAISLADETKVMLAGISRASVFGTVELAEFAASAGYDIALLKRPHASVERPQELLTYFQAVADQSPLPIALYSTRAAAMPVEAILALALHPNIIALVDEESDAEKFRQVRAATASVSRDVTVTHVFAAVTGRMRAGTQDGPAVFVSAESLGGGAAVATAPPRPAIKTRNKKVGFQVVAASSQGMLDGLRAGATGAMPAFAASAPQAVYEVYAAWKDDDQPLAEVKQARIAPAIEIVEQKYGLAGIRYGSELTGYYGGRPRLPVLPLSGEAREAVEHVMQGIRN